MIVLTSVCKQFGAKVLYDSISTAINPAFRTALIGPNGAGKTLLVRIIAGMESPDSGSVSVPSGIRMAYLPQEVSVEEEISPLDFVLRPFARLLDAHRQLELADSRSLHRAIAEYESTQTELAVHGGYGVEARAKTILAGLGVPSDAWERDIRRLSGGYRMRVVLAQLLLQSPDFLMLDEPTNHLDMDSLIWLEKFLQRFAGGMLVISHDRDFLNRTTTHTAELAGGTMTIYAGPVDRFFEWKEQVEQTESKRHRNVQARIDQAEDFVRRFKSKATKASQARSRMKLIERLREDLPEQHGVVAPTLKLTIPAPPRSAAVPLAVSGLSVCYDAGPVFSNLSLSVNAGDKIAIIGPNGAGKSTLLKALAGQVTPAQGRIEVNGTTAIRYYSQHRLEQLDPRKTLYQTIQDVIGGDNRNAIQSVLGAFLFSGDDALKTVGVLSGGEKSRLSLAAILSNPGNLLLLDEPTNHLDVETVERLGEALAGYEGTVILVSHEERFISQTANRIFEMRPGVVRDFPGTLTDYRSYIEAGYLDPLVENTAGASTESVSIQGEAKQERIRRREERRKLERRRERIEASIGEAEGKIDELKRFLEDPAHATDHERLLEADKSLRGLEKEYDSLLAQWDEVETQLRECGS